MDILLKKNTQKSSQKNLQHWKITQKSLQTIKFTQKSKLNNKNGLGVWRLLQNILSCKKKNYIYIILLLKMKYLLQHCCRTTQSCRHKAWLSSSGPDSIEKDFWVARRADCSRQWQARLHTIGFEQAEGQHTFGVFLRPSLRVLYGSHES